MNRPICIEVRQRRTGARANSQPRKSITRRARGNETPNYGPIWQVVSGDVNRSRA
jgi:hypothetical protein